ncbi:hypothetical protein [Actinoplanes xinjiangensis]|uniref:hypothetical protein n=1 Tax=Actinoplanes xinjiangensis TaxID=512350 RepID=UPI0034283AEF
MMIVRELTGGCRTAARLGDRRLPSIVERGTEAAVVGIAAALRPLDTVTASAGPPSGWRPSGSGKDAGPAPLTIWLGDQASGKTAPRLSALFTPLGSAAAPVAEDTPDVTVDGGDVEKVLVAARHAARSARMHVPRVLHLVNGGPEYPRDPIAALSCSLLQDRHLDANAVASIGRDARRVAAALSAADLRPATGAPVPHGLRAGPLFLQDFAAYVLQLSSAWPALAAQPGSQGAVEP